MGNTPTTFEDSVKERLKSIVADLIPEDRWDDIVRKTVVSFEKDDLPRLVKSELTERYKKAISEEFSKPEWQGQWNTIGMQASPMLQKLIVDAAPLVLAGLIGGSMEQMIQNLKYAIQNRTF